MSLLDSLKNRPNFFLIGAQKSGTTRLHFLLAQHPEIFGTNPKEPRFFNVAAPTPHQQADYIALFGDAEGAKAMGESTVAYSCVRFFPGTAERIYQFNPQAKIIYIVRHPLRRIESAWMHGRNDHPRIPRSFCETVRREEFRLIHTTRYWEQLTQYRHFFPDRQILLLFFEEFVRDEAATLRRCFEFLGVETDVTIDCSSTQKQNASAGKFQSRSQFDALRQLRGYAFLRARLPEPLKRFERRLFMERMLSRPEWDEKTWRWTVEQLRGDTEQFLAHAGKSINFWDWNLDSTSRKFDWATD